MKKLLLLASTLGLLATPAFAAASKAPPKAPLIPPPAAVPAPPAPAQPAAPVAASDTIVVDQSKPMVARGAGQQSFTDTIDLAPGQETLPLKLTFTNGSDTAPSYKWLRVSIAGRPFLTEKDFKGNKTM